MAGRGVRAKGTQIVLTGDIGGTKSRLGLFRFEHQQCRLTVERTFHSEDYPSLEMILREFLRGQEKIASGCLGIAGPVTNGIIKTTNLPWRIDIRTIQKELSIGKVEIVNDLVANAYGIFMLEKKDFETLNTGKAKKANAALISAGTGLGEAVLFWDGKEHMPCPSEGGHVEFGPRNDLEIELLQYLFDRFGHVSYERLLSGNGLLHIYRFLRDSKRFGTEPAWLSKKMRQEDPAAVISETAQLKKNRLCVKALDLFTSIYGAAAGNLALQVMAVGGIYIGGGIAPKIIWKLKDGTFMEAFKDKGRLSEMVAQIPVKVIMNDNAALLGTAYRAVELLDE
jgi:glucokinase